MNVSGCIPCFNNESTLARCIESVWAQKVDEVIVLDDGSTDRSVEIATRLGARVVQHQASLGRGAVRARGIFEARHEFILSCDATNVLAPDFAEKALRWFKDDRVAAVCGVIRGYYNETAAERWRNRHLFKTDLVIPLQHGVLLATYGLAMRRSAFLEVGNFDPALRAAEDAEVGRKLLDGGFDVIGDPEVVTQSIARNTVLQVLERYWRWNVHEPTAITLQLYLRNLAYAFKVMAREDLRAGDWQSTCLSLLCPHYPLLRKLGFHP